MLKDIKMFPSCIYLYGVFHFCRNFSTVIVISYLGNNGHHEAGGGGNKVEEGGDVICNLAGRKVDASAKGILIRNGKKIMVK